MKEVESNQQQHHAITTTTSTLDPEAAVVAVSAAVSSTTTPPASSSDVRGLQHSNTDSYSNTHISAFEIEMGQRVHDDNKITPVMVDNDDNDMEVGVDDDNNRNNICHTTDISEIPSILTAPSMDESIDDNDLMEMESLLQRMNDKKENKTNKKTCSKNNTDTIELSSTKPLDIETTDNNENHTHLNESASSPSSHNISKWCSNYNISCCLPCQNNNNNSSLSSEGKIPINNKPYRMGNIHVLYPPIYNHTKGWGVLGPHWFGPLFILLIIVISSYYIIYIRCYQRHWYFTTIICTLLCTSTIYHLFNTSYRDPGVILKNSLPINHTDPNAIIPRSYRYCDICQYYQPSHAAHCPDCNVCVAGFDHHCVWMSICIGVNNYKPFMRFNLSWLAYVVYAVVWVAVIAPIFD